MHTEHMQEHCLIFSTLCSAHNSLDLVESIPNTPRKYARTSFFRCSTLCSAHSSPELVKSIPNAPRKYARTFAWDVQRYVLRTIAQNLSKVSQMHPENMQEHCLRFPTLCSAHSSPELVKSIPNAPRKYARTVFVFFDAMFCAQWPRACQPPQRPLCRRPPTHRNSILLRSKWFFEKQIQVWSIHGHRGWPHIDHAWVLHCIFAFPQPSVVTTTLRAAMWGLGLKSSAPLLQTSGSAGQSQSKNICTDFTNQSRSMSCRWDYNVSFSKNMFS